MFDFILSTFTNMELCLSEQRGYRGPGSVQPLNTDGETDLV